MLVHPYILEFGSSMMFLSARVRKLFGALLIRGSVMGVQFLVSILIAVVGGPVGAGIYGLYNAWLAIFTGVAGLGSNTHALRSVSVLASRGEGEAIVTYLKLLLRPVMSVILLFGLGLVLFSFELSGRFLGDETLSYVIVTAVISGGLTILARIGSESLKGLEKLNIALLLEWALLPTSVALTLLVFYWGWGSIDMTVLLILRTLYIAIIAVLLFFVLRRAVKGLSAPKTRLPKVGIKSLSPFWGSELSIVWFMNIPLLVLPYYATTAEIGVFSIAQKLILTVTSALVVLTGIYGPRLARAYEEQNTALLKRLLVQTQVISVGLYLPLLISFTLFPKFVMGLFGEEFESGSEMLKVMAFGQLIYAICGLGDYLLNMIHREKWFFAINTIGTVFMAITCLYFGRERGVEGIAIAVACSLAVKQVLGYVAAIYALRRTADLFTPLSNQ